MSHYDKHVFFCVNQREAGADCCNNAGASDLQAYAKDKLKTLKASQAGRVRINRAGCLGRCDDGPVMVVYPEGVWYQVFDRADIDEIIEKHLIGQVPVERLRI